VFYCIAAICPAVQTQVVHPDLQFESVPRWRMLKAVASASFASVAGQYSLRSCRREIAKLQKQLRIEVEFPSEPGRLLYVMSNLSLGLKAGGSVGHIAGVINGLLHNGWEVDAAAVERPAMVSASAGYHPLSPPRTYGVPYELARYRFHSMVVRQINSLPEKQHYNLIYQRLSNSNYSGVVLSRQLRLPLIMEYNGSEVWVAKNWGSGLRYPHDAAAVEAVCLRHAHLVVTVSDVLRDELIERGVDPKRIVSYPNCIDPAIFDPNRFSTEQIQQLRSRLGFAPEEVIGGFVGSFGEWHGVDVLAKAICDLVDNHEDWLLRTGTRFLLVGDGAKMSAVQQILAGEKYRRYCALPGLVAQSEAALHMAACDMLLSPHVPNPDGSRFFGSPTKLFEYMAMGKAIIASDLEQIGEVLRGSRHISDERAASAVEDAPAIFCRPSDVGDIVQSVRLLAEERQLRESLGKAARQRALASYTWDAHVGQILRSMETIRQS
jgi:glycosyltransferase involved in cell wall biosynthesis